MTDASLFAIAQHCPALNIIVITNCPNVSNKVFERVLQMLCQLKSVRIKNMPHLKNSTLTFMVRNNLWLENIWLYKAGLSFEGLQYIILHAKR